MDLTLPIRYMGPIERETIDIILNRFSSDQFRDWAKWANRGKPELRMIESAVFSAQTLPHPQRRKFIRKFVDLMGQERFVVNLMQANWTSFSLEELEASDGSRATYEFLDSYRMKTWVDLDANTKSLSYIRLSLADEMAQDIQDYSNVYFKSLNPYERVVILAELANGLVNDPIASIHQIDFDEVIISIERQLYNEVNSNRDLLSDIIGSSIVGTPVHAAYSRYKTRLNSAHLVEASRVNHSCRLVLSNANI